MRFALRALAAVLVIVAGLAAILVFAGTREDGRSVVADPPLPRVQAIPSTTSTTEEPVTTTTTEAAPVQQAPAVQFSYPPECYGRTIPPAQLWNESKCSFDPGLQSPPSFCSGRGCIGPYQIDNGHFAEVSPWNSNVSGACFGLDPSTLAGQEECARRLGPGAWG